MDNYIYYVIQYIISCVYPIYTSFTSYTSYISYISYNMEMYIVYFLSIHIYPYLSYISLIYTLIYTNIIYTSNEIHKSSPALAQGSVLGISLSSCEPQKSAKPHKKWPNLRRIYEGSTKDLPSPCSWDYNGPIHGF